MHLHTQTEHSTKLVITGRLSETSRSLNCTEGACVFLSQTLLSATEAKSLRFLVSLLKLIMTRGKKGLVMHSQRVRSIVYNSPQIATITTSLRALCPPHPHPLSLFPALFTLFLSASVILSLSHTHTHSSTAVVHYGVVTRQHLIAIIGRMYRAACLNTC